MRKFLFPHQTYFVTTNIRHREWIFVDRVTHAPRPESCDILIANLSFYKRKFEFLLFGYVIMPDHVHLLLRIGEKGTIADIMRDWKHRTAFEMNALLQLHGPLWQEDYWAHGLTTDNELDWKLEYIHLNPVRAGLVVSPSQWPYSSAGWYEEGRPGSLGLDPLR